MTYNGFPITVHQITTEAGKVLAVVNKGAAKSAYTFKVAVEKIEGLVIA